MIQFYSFIKMIFAKLVSSFILLAVASSIRLPKQSYPGQVVFLGDSITDFWRQNGWQPWGQFYEPVGAINTGIAGDRTINTIERINGGIIDNLNAKLAILLIGTNDLAWGGLDEAQTSANIGIIIDLIQAKNPGVKILLLGVLPRMESDIHQKIVNLNALISQRANGNDLFYLDMGDQFSTGLGQIIPNLYSDGVHLTSEGYNVWAATMNPLFFELLDQPGPSTLSPGPTTSTTPAPGMGELVFLGDSITASWAGDGKTTWDIFYGPIGAINTGVSGDLTSNTIQRINNEGIIDNLNAKVAVLKIGTNDLSWGVADEEIIFNIGLILNLIRDKNPGVHILLLGILPRSPAEIHQRAKDINSQLAQYASASDVTFLDMNDAFSHDVGYVFPELYTADYLHLGPAGYVMWAVQMNPVLFTLLNSK